MARKGEGGKEAEEISTVHEACLPNRSQSDMKYFSQYEVIQIVHLASMKEGEPNLSLKNIPTISTLGNRDLCSAARTTRNCFLVSKHSRQF